MGKRQPASSRPCLLSAALAAASVALAILSTSRAPTTFSQCSRTTLRPLPQRSSGLALRRAALEAEGVLEVGADELEAAVRAGGAVVLDVYAVWCGPCKLLEPALDSLAQRLASGEFDEEGLPFPEVLRMDSDVHPAKASSLMVEGLPTIIFFKDGVETGRLEGAVTLSQLESAAESALQLDGLAVAERAANRLKSMEELELLVQIEEVLVLGVMGSGKWEEDSSAIESTLQILGRELREDDVQVVTADASKMPGVVQSMQLGELPAVVLFHAGEKLAQLEGQAAVGAKVEELAGTVREVLES